jgi:hypothetical protein
VYFEKWNLNYMVYIGGRGRFAYFWRQKGGSEQTFRIKSIRSQTANRNYQEITN